MDGAWTGHPDQNEIAVSQFPASEINFRARRPTPRRILIFVRCQRECGKRTLAERAPAVRTVIRYRNGVLNGKGRGVSSMATWKDSRHGSHLPADDRSAHEATRDTKSKFLMREACRFFNTRRRTHAAISLTRSSTVCCGEARKSNDAK